MYHMWQFLLANNDLKSLETTQQFFTHYTYEIYVLFLFCIFMY